jgi:tetratricopeptide (TPR) repeat protein
MEPKPVEAKPVAMPKQDAPIETQKPFVPPPPQPSVATPAPQPAAPPAQKKKIGLPARKQQPEGVNAIVALNQAKGELDRGDIPAALSHYAKLIKKGKHLEETIRDLTESIYRYPVEVGIWQTLGDAYMRANRLKEALEAYNKAEELIR